MRRVLIAVLGLILSHPALADVPKFDPDACATTIAPFVDNQTIAVVRVEPQRLNGAALVDLAAQFTDWDANEKTTVQHLIEDTIKPELQKAGIRQVYLLVTLADLMHPVAFVVPREENGNPDAKKLAELFQKLYPIPGGAFHFEAKGNVYLGGSKALVNYLKAMQPQARPDLGKALATAGEGDSQIVVIPSADQRRTAEELNPMLPPIAGGGATKLVTRGVMWAAVGIELAPKFKIRATIQSENEEAAKALKARIPTFLTLAGAAVDIVGDPFGGKLVPELAGDQLRIEVADAELVAGMARLAKRAQEASLVRRRENNVKSIALAFHNYHDVNGQFPGYAFYGYVKDPPNAKPSNEKPDPTAKPGKDSKPLLSWRVLLLPFLDQDKLFREFKMDEPWDSEHNNKLIARMPAIFRSGNRKLDEAGKTRIVVPVAKGTIFEPDGPGTKISEVHDGTSHTILALEAAEANAVIWTKPDDLEIDAKNPTKGVFNPGASFVLTAMADGSVHQLSTKIKPEMLLWMFLRADGHPIVWP